MDETTLKYTQAKEDAEKLGLSGDWTISDALGGFVKVAHKCGLCAVGNRNSAYSVLSGDTVVVSSVSLKDAVGLIKIEVTSKAKPAPKPVESPVTKEQAPAPKPTVKPAETKKAKKTKGK